MSSVVLDACALIAYLRDEPGGDQLEEKLTQPGERVLMHVLNLGEVYYDGLRRGDQTIVDLWKDVSDLGIIVRRDVDDDFIAVAARWKARHRIAYADSFALALADKESASSVSTDHKEFDSIAAEGKVKFLWLR